MDFSEIFEWAENHLHKKNVIGLNPNEYIYLLGGCWMRMQFAIHEQLTKQLVLQMRQSMRQYLMLEYQKGMHHFQDYDYLLDGLILPNMSFDILGRTHTFLEIEDMVLSREL